jgi:hypothetical protein
MNEMNNTKCHISVTVVWSVSTPPQPHPLRPTQLFTDCHIATANCIKQSDNKVAETERIRLCPADADSFSSAVSNTASLDVNELICSNRSWWNLICVNLIEARVPVTSEINQSTVSDDDFASAAPWRAIKTTIHEVKFSKMKYVNWKIT